jgi:hypothetical protein
LKKHLKQQQGVFQMRLKSTCNAAVARSARKALMQRVLRRNIGRVLDAATVEEYQAGVGWYREAREYAQGLSETFGVGLAASCAVVAVLSPGTDWTQNKRDARNLLSEVVDGVVGHRYTTYGPNVLKARTIAELEVRECDWEGFVRGPKVTSFWRNILECATTGPVTVDFHAYGIATGRRYTTATVPKFGPKEYAMIAQAYRDVAREKDLLPQDLQAITWGTWKRLGKEARV